jgi:hypothetical protein
MNEWIDVDEEMPEQEIDVLVCGIRFGAVYFDIAGFFHGSWQSLVTEKDCLFDVTHWQPLPEPPTFTN